jgi:16S rRNA (cytidine1402-2'-O)-methyltransferase
MKEAVIYLIPNLLGDSNDKEVLPETISNLVIDLKYYIVENIRTARRFLKKINPEIVIDSLTFYELNKHTNPNEIHKYLKPAKNGNNIGIITDAGVPGVADPGADIVKIAHQIGIKVKPLVGPSSILMAVMSSGLNGQNFAFNGYLPIKKPDRINKIRFYEKRSRQENQSQAFIETPYRNNALFEDIVSFCHPETMLCIAVDITLPTEYILTKKIQQWKSTKVDLHKRPCIFIIHSY